jgi:hypothetical protein
MSRTIDVGSRRCEPTGAASCGSARSLRAGRGICRAARIRPPRSGRPWSRAGPGRPRRLRRGCEIVCGLGEAGQRSPDEPGVERDHQPVEADLGLRCLHASAAEIDLAGLHPPACRIPPPAHVRYSRRASSMHPMSRSQGQSIERLVPGPLHGQSPLPAKAAGYRAACVRRDGRSRRHNGLQRSRS